MQYQITSTDWWDSECIIEHYPCLKDFGFENKEVEAVVHHEFIRDENGKVIVQPIYGIKKIPFVNIDSLEQLNEFIKTVDTPIIISEVDCIYGIEIYDDYREQKGE